MSALRNAVKRKTHKERSQPGDRRKFGLLEKKKDYVLRARDFHKKEDAIKALKTKAAYRNPDEFYFGMERNRTKDGVHVGRADESNKYTAEELALMKTQDVKYVALKASVEAKKAAKLKANLHRVGLDADEDALSEEEEERYDDEGFVIRAAPRQKRKHTVFVDDAETARAFDADARKNARAWRGKNAKTAEEDASGSNPRTRGIRNTKPSRLRRARWACGGTSRARWRLRRTARTEWARPPRGGRPKDGEALGEEKTRRVRFASRTRKARGAAFDDGGGDVFAAGDLARAGAQAQDEGGGGGHAGGAEAPQETRAAVQVEEGTQAVR
jgi:hypothetical protein